MTFVQAKCTNCGGLLTVDEKKDAAICPYCNTPYIVEKAINHYNVTNNITVSNGGVINVFEEKSDFEIESGVLKAYHGASLEVTIPDNVVIIGDKAFANSAVTSVVLPKTIKRIRNRAFAGCTELLKITIPETVEHIGEGAFSDCKKLKEIMLPDSITEISCGLFSRSGLTSIAISSFVTTIRTRAFLDCKNLKKIVIPDTLDALASDAFSGCVFDEIKIPCSVEPGNVGVLYGAKTNRLILSKGNGTMNPRKYASTVLPWFSGTCKELVIEDGVKNIPPYAFKGVSELEKLFVSKSVKSIGQYAFDDCNIEELIMPSNIKIGHHAIYTYWIKNGLCPVCGGTFGLFGKCRSCGTVKPK